MRLRTQHKEAKRLQRTAIDPGCRCRLDEQRRSAVTARPHPMSTALRTLPGVRRSGGFLWARESTNRPLWYRTLWQNTMRLLRISIAVFVTALGSSLANGQPTPEFGTCEVCCWAYPSGWRGMCVRRCHAYRRSFPKSDRAIMRCDCWLNWRREWTCGR